LLFYKIIEPTFYGHWSIDLFLFYSHKFANSLPISCIDSKKILQNHTFLVLSPILYNENTLFDHDFHNLPLSFSPWAYPLPTTQLIKYFSPQYQQGAIIYKNCSSTFCEACLNPYQCLGCSVNYAPACCPKFCSKCIDMDHCIQCELYFVLYPYGKGIYCQRASNLTDPYTNPYSYDVISYQHITATTMHQRLLPRTCDLKLSQL